MKCFHKIVESSRMKEEVDNEDDGEETGGSSEEEGEDSRQKAKQAITCRSVTLNTLMEDGIILPGQGVLSIDYLGQKFEADLLESGKIKWHGSEEEFGTPSAWALHCKRLVNPIKRSGCGWASVKYKNKKLDIWKSMWARKHRTTNPFKTPSISGTPPSTSPPSATVETSSTSSAIATATPDSCDTVPDSDVIPVTHSRTAEIKMRSLSPLENPSTSKIISIPPAQKSPLVSSDMTKSPFLLSSPSTTFPHPLPPPLHPPPPLVPSVTSSALVEEKVAAKIVPPGNKDIDAGSERRSVEKTEENSAVLTRSIQSAAGCTAQLSPLKEIHPVAVSPSKKARKSSFDEDLKKPGESMGVLGPAAQVLSRAKYRYETLATLSQERKSVPYSALGTRGVEVDALTLVKCEVFDNHSKIQPFTVSVTSNSLLLMDFHCHLTKSEVVGYLGGRWDSHKQHLSLEQVFPLCCRLGDKERAPLLEEDVRRCMQQKNQMLVGWYHSHPYCQPDPTLKDVDCQMSFQLKMRGSGAMYLPCLGFIVSPFEKFPPKSDSKIQAFWVMPNLEHPSSYNIPMHVDFSVVRDNSLTEDLLSDMKSLTEFYSCAVDRVLLKEHWGEAITYLDKIKASLRSKLPEDQLTSGTFLDYVQQLLKGMK